MNTESFVKCSGCNCLRNEVTEYEVYKGTRRKICNVCKEKKRKYNCAHGRRKVECRDCGGSQICIHDKRISICCNCGGIDLCIHKRQKAKCIECNGVSICIHDKQRTHCKICSPNLVIINIIRSQIRRCFNVSTLTKINHSVEYLGCDTDTLKQHIQSKMTDEMTFDNIHYDHIKPVTCFDLDDEDEFLKCCHFTNLQPLLAKDNLRLKNKWTDENETFWNEYIIYKPEFKTLYKI
jgi:undecaprenyl pyrophosphate synthase